MFSVEVLYKWTMITIMFQTHSNCIKKSQIGQVSVKFPVLEELTQTASYLKHFTEQIIATWHECNYSNNTESSKVSQHLRC